MKTVILLWVLAAIGCSTTKHLPQQDHRGMYRFTILSILSPVYGEAFDSVSHEFLLKKLKY